MEKHLHCVAILVLGTPEEEIHRVAEAGGTVSNLMVPAGEIVPVRLS